MSQSSQDKSPESWYYLLFVSLAIGASFFTRFFKTGLLLLASGFKSKRRMQLPASPLQEAQKQPSDFIEPSSKGRSGSEQQETSTQIETLGSPVQREVQLLTSQLPPSGVSHHSSQQPKQITTPIPRNVSIEENAEEDGAELLDDTVNSSSQFFSPTPVKAVAGWEFTGSDRALMYHKGLLEYLGIIVIAPTKKVADNTALAQLERTAPFRLGRQEYRLTKSMPSDAHIKLQRFAAKRELEFATQTEIINTERRGEAYSPFLLLEHNKTPGEFDGLFLNFWSSSGRLIKAEELTSFAGYHSFSTALCLGLGIRGITGQGVSRILIKHDIEFLPGEKIHQIDILSENNPYEAYSINEFEKFCQFFSLTTVKDARVICHVPWVDYMFFGVALYFKNRITLEALGDYFKEILNKKISYGKKLDKLASKYNLNLEMISPLENIFDSTTPETLLNPEEAGETGKTFALKLLNHLGVSESDCSDDPQTQARLESDFVKHCLQKLRENKRVVRHAEVWRAFVATPRERDEFLVHSREGLQISSALAEEQKALEAEKSRVDKTLQQCILKIKAAGKDENLRDVLGGLSNQPKGAKSYASDLALSGAQILQKAEVQLLLRSKLGLKPKEGTAVPQVSDETKASVQAFLTLLSDYSALINVQNDLKGKLEDKAQTKKRADDKKTARSLAEARLGNPPAHYDLLIPLQPGKAGINTIEDLFALSNAFVPAYASYGRGAYESCSLLPSTEKQIQVGLQNLTPLLQLPPELFPQVMNATVFNTVTGVGMTTNPSGSLFYLTEGLTPACNALNKLLPSAFETQGKLARNGIKLLSDNEQLGQLRRDPARLTPARSRRNSGLSNHAQGFLRSPKPSYPTSPQGIPPKLEQSSNNSSSVVSSLGC